MLGYAHWLLLLKAAAAAAAAAVGMVELAGAWKLNVLPTDAARFLITTAHGCQPVASMHNRIQLTSS